MRGDDIRGLMRTSDPAALKIWNRICDEHDTSQARARQMLRSLGVKLAHPDDGWVHRRADGSGRFSLSWYPLFNDHPEVGDLIAFGYPYPTEHARLRQPSSAGVDEGYRIVRVTAVERRMSVLGRIERFEFSPAESYWPPLKKCRGFRFLRRARSAR